MRKLWPGAVVLAAMVALVLLFYGRLVLQGLIIGDYDAFVYFYPLREYAAEAIRQGRFPLWNPNLYLGAPFFANLQTAVLYPPNVLFVVLPVPYAFSASVVLHVLLAGVAMYLFCRRILSVSAAPALLAAVAFMFSGFLSNQVGHINQLNVSAWLPLLLVVYDEALRRRSLALGIVAGWVGSLQFLAGHTQEWYFSTAALGLFAVWRMISPWPSPRLVAAPFMGARSIDRERAPIKGAATHYAAVAGGGVDSPPGRGGLGEELSRRVRPLSYLALAGLVEAGTTAVQVLPSFELSRESIRGGGMHHGEAISFSLPITSALYTVLPTYPSELFSEYVGYVGVVALVLAVLAGVRWAARPATCFMGGLVAVGFLMALGGYNPAYPFLLHWIPGLDLFRVPARWLLIYTFGICGLAALGAQVLVDVARGRRGGIDLSSGGSRLAWPLRVAIAVLLAGGGTAALVVLVFLARTKPTVDQVQVWGALAALTLGLVGLGSLGRRVGRISLLLLIGMVAAELWVVGANTVFRHPIPVEAFRPERTSTTLMLEDAARTDRPGRLLSFATDQYEVKETPDYRKDYWWLDEEALHQFLVAVKLSESMAPNLPMLYGIETVDGYDGGVLPLKRWAELKRLLVPEPGIPADNQIRTHLDYVPPDFLLDLLNVRYVLGNKIQDTQIDNVYYDRGISLVVEPGETRTLQRMPDAMTTSVGIISSTEGARELWDGVEAGALVLVDVSGAEYRLPLRLGLETGETPERDSESLPAAHRKPQAVPTWWPGGTDVNYFAKIHLPARIRVKELRVSNSIGYARLRIRALTLIDDAAPGFSSLVLSDRLDRHLFFDTKVYVNRNPWPRAFMVHSSTVRDDDLAMESLRSRQFSLDRTVVLAPSPTARTVYRAATPGSSPDEARLRSDQPEEIVVDVAAREEGYLVLGDAYYPGWTAEVDGAPAPIERANFMFRAVWVDRGEHTVVFRYTPQLFQTGLRITLASLALQAVALLGLAAYRWRRRGSVV